MAGRRSSSMGSMGTYASCEPDSCRGTLMKRIHIVTLIVILISSWTALVWSQDANGDRVTVSWSDPSRPGLLKVTLIQGGITVKTHSGNNVIIEGKTRGRGNNRR